MARRSEPPSDDAAEDLLPPGPYDPVPGEEDTLWFLPDEAAPTAGDPPWRILRSDAAASRPADWAAAEAANAGLLARAALTLGALDERVRHCAEGLRRRLVCLEAAELSWHLGERVTVDRLALYMVQRLSATGVDAQPLARAAWAVRRLERSQPPDPDALAEFLGREAVLRSGADVLTRPVGAEFAALAADWRRELEAGAVLHPVTRAALAWHAWRRHGLSGDEAMIEGAVVAARLGGAALRPGGLGFLPVALGGSAPLRGAAGAHEALSAWLQGVEAAALRGLMEADRVDRWLRRAEDAIAPMSGRTPSRLLAALQKWPLVSAPMLETETGVSRAAVQRNMTRLEELGLVDEVTGQSRFRFWRLALGAAGAPDAASGG